jgi:hypothetical protein
MLSVQMINWMDAFRTGRSTTGEGMMEPPAWIKQAYTLYDKRMVLTYGSDEYKATVQDEKDYYFKNVPAIPLIEKSKLPLPVSNRLGNTPTGGYQITSLMISEHYYVK